MNIQLPELFQKKMKTLLQSEYEAFLHSYDEPRQQGLRVNTLKANLKDFLSTQPFSLEPIPWVPEGFYYGNNDRPGRHAWHEAGVYYIQEPSAMAVAELVDPQPGERVLDLCAAPGGKTTHLAMRMAQQGLLVANEPHPARARILSQNVERMGVRNAVVTNEMPDRLSARFPAYFDRILVDAPCSGEGMFRKDPAACGEWSPDGVELCSSRQSDILRHAAIMLQPGGRLVYSTCTFSPEENEGTISRFLQEHAEFEIEAVEVACEGLSPGRPEWAGSERPGLERTFRIWPHIARGEGHYAAVLRKCGGEEYGGKRRYAEGLRTGRLPADYAAFAQDALIEAPSGMHVLFGEQLYLLPEEMLDYSGLKIIRPGWHLGTLKKNRFEPSHAFAMSLDRQAVKQALDLSPESPEQLAYLRGETLSGSGSKGWQLVLAGDYSIGWGKLANGQLKNHFPKGLRWQTISGSWSESTD